MWTVLGVIVGLQAIMLLQLAKLSGRVRRMSAPKPAAAPPAEQQDGALEETKARNAEQKQWFAMFLEEDPSRRELPKKEQFEAFRRWRNERGLNWRAPGDPV